MATFRQLLDNLDADPRVRGKQFERICKWYLQHEPVYRADLDKVWLWDDWPDRDGPDVGIDLVAKTKSGDLWAIQAKAHDPEKNLAKSHVDSFLANSARSEFTFRLILTTSADLSGNLWKQLAKIEPRASARVLSDLHAARLDWPESPSSLRAPPPEPKKPFDHQKEAIRDVVKGFKTSDRGQLIMACGTGKTLVGLWVAQRLKSERTLVLLPSLSLLSQVMEEWLLNGKGQSQVLAVCSDESVTKGADEWVSNTAELGFPVTTDPEAIAEELEQPGPVLVFATYHSSPRVAAAQRLTDAAFDLAVADEAHRCAGRVSSDFATILDSNEIRAEKRLFMTATPRYFSGRVKKLAGQEEMEIASMDDEAQFGAVLHRLTFGEAIERDLLSPYQVVVVGVDEPMYRRYAERGQLVIRDGKEITDARYLATQIALAKAMRDYDLKRTITFHGRVNRAREFAEDFPEVVEWLPEDDRPEGELWCDHVSGKMPTSQRRARLDQLRGLDESERGLLANAKCLGEGVDVPTLDGVAFIDPRRSQVDIVQNVGRAIRKAENKKVGTIILPVFIDSMDDDPEAVIADSAFKPIFDVLRALRDHNDELAEGLDAIRRARDWGTTGSAPAWPHQIKFDLPKSVDTRFARAFYARALDRVADRPTLTVEQILAWADAYYDRSGDWPKERSGSIEGTYHESWHAVDSALRLGSRGLPGGSSLPRLLAGHRDVRNIKELPDFTIGKILAWADAYHQRTGEWPSRHSGPIPEAPGESWNAVRMALRLGSRGLSGGVSLVQLLIQHRDVHSLRHQPELTTEQILVWADAHHAHTGSWPSRTSGNAVDSATEKWSAIDTALNDGLRGLPGGSSLPRLLAEHRGVRNIHDLPDLTVEQILAWADAHQDRTGEWPNPETGAIPGSDGETWKGVQNALVRGSRGLSGASSLANLLLQERGVQHRLSVSRLTIQDILSWADAHHARTGSWPKRKSGTIHEAPNETWSKVDDALKQSSRGLSGSSSLSKLLAEQRSVHNVHKLPALSIEQILSWADAHHENTGKWPRVTSGSIEGTHGENWTKIENALRLGLRGLPGGSSLARLLSKHRDARNVAKAPSLTVHQILLWADGHYSRNGCWPRTTSGAVHEAPEEKWANINASLHAGNRGLPGGSSLAKLLDEHRRKKK